MIEFQVNSILIYYTKAKSSASIQTFYTAITIIKNVKNLKV